MKFNIWAAEISVAFKIIVFFCFFFNTCMLQINRFLNYLYVILIFFVFILKADESGE
jgi:hypothetical protein